MAHKSKKGENAINKTFIFKVKCGKGDITSLWKPAMEEYCTYYNKVSKWICDNLTTMRIGDLAQYIESKGTVYYAAVTDESKKDLPLYRMFKKGFNAQCADNALFEAIRKLNPEGYCGNAFGLSETSYRRQGYVASVIGNYRTKMAEWFRLGKLKWHKFDTNDVTDEVLAEQCIVDTNKYGIENKNDFKGLIETLKSREETPQLVEKIARLERLYEYYAEHEQEIKARLETMAVENLQNFGGCTRRSMDTCTITIQDFPMECVGNTGYSMKITFNGKPCTIELLGNRQVVTCKNGERAELVDIANNHGGQITFNIRNGELFAHLTSSVEFSKEPTEIRNVVGVDVNIKHNMLATSIIDNGDVKGYINLYRELVGDADFAATCTQSELELYSQMAETVNFGVLETDSLFERFVYQKNSADADGRLVRREEAMRRVFEAIAKTNPDIHIVNYVNAVKMLRAKYKAYFTLKEKYYEKQHEYDKAMGFTDESTESKETMDCRRSEFPFINTDTAKELLAKMDSVEQDIIGCRDNIVTYAFNVFRDNGFDTIGLEYLESSQFEKRRMPTPKSLMKYHRLEGKTREEVSRAMSEKRFNRDHYEMAYNDGKLSDVSLSRKGALYQQKLNFGNLAIKAIHFADIKDKFVQLTNNTDMNAVFCPAAFTSQMDSITHSLYLVEKESSDNGGGKKPKFVLANKKSVRTQQERHINGLNADYNSACNIAHIASDDTLRGMMTEATKGGKHLYGAPSHNIQKRFKKNVSAATLKAFTDLGHTVKGRIVDGMFVACEQ